MVLSISEEEMKCDIKMHLKTSIKSNNFHRHATQTIPWEEHRDDPQVGTIAIFSASKDRRSLML